jgi:hypothetical protein
MVLDGMRPYLIQDGGNVSIEDIDGPVVRLMLEVSYFLFVVCSLWSSLKKREAFDTNLFSTFILL